MTNRDGHRRRGWRCHCSAMVAVVVEINKGLFSISISDY
jgi:hypothetical protein